MSNVAGRVFIAKDNNVQDGQVIYWFELSGTDYGTDRHFDGDVYGVCEEGDESFVVDCDNCPMTPGDGITIAVEKALDGAVTDKLREM